MPSALPLCINKNKYQLDKANLFGSWVAPVQEEWVKDAGVWKEPQIVFVKKSGAWIRRTTITQYLVGNTTIGAVSTTSNAWNMYVDSGATQAVYIFEFVLVTTATRQTLFSYGLTDETNFFEIYIDTSNRVVASSRFSSGTIANNIHATGLTAGVHYQATIKTRTGSNPKCTIDILDMDTNTAVGSQKTTNTFPAYSTSPTPKYLFRRFSTTQYNFRGIITRVYIYGAQSTSANKTTFDSGTFVSGSTAGSGTLTNTITSDYGNGINFTISNAIISSTG